MWRLLTWDLKQQTVGLELPFDSFAYTETLNGDGDFTVEIPLVSTTPSGRRTITERYLTAPASTNDQDVMATSDRFAISGSIEVQSRLIKTAASGTQKVAGNWFFGAIKAWNVEIVDDYPTMSTSGTGGADSTMTATVALSDVGVSDGSVFWLKATYNVSTQVASFFYRLTETGSWTQLGATVAGNQTALNVISTSIALFQDAAGDLASSVYWVMILDGIDGTVVGRIDAADASDATSAFTDMIGTVWTPQGASLTLSDPVQVTVDTSAPQITAADVCEGCHAVFFENNGTVLWGGVVWGVDADVETNRVTISGAGWLSYFRHRYIRSTVTYTATEQLNIARGIIDTAQAVANGDIGVLTSETHTSGVTRDRTYWGYERRNVADVVQQLAAVQNGFDFRFHSFRDSNGDITVEFRTTYPATGRRTAYVLELGSNIQLLGYQSTGAYLANTVDAVGAGDGDDLLIRTAQNPAGLADRPLLETVLSLPEVSVAGTLLEHASRRLGRGSTPATSLAVTVFPDQIPTLGSYVIGDQVYVKGSYGYVVLGGWYRITSLRVQMDSDGGETVTLLLVPGGLFDE